MLMIKFQKLILSILLLSSTFVFGQTTSKSGSTYPNFSSDGAWCWFSDPRSIYVSGNKPGILSGWVKTDGSIETGLMNTSNFQIEYQTLYPQMQEDDHDHPAFVEIGNQDFLAFYTKHGDGSIYINRSSKDSKTLFQKTDSIRPISDLELEKFPRNTLTYANPFVLKNENDKLFVFGRWTGFKPNLIWSEDNGQTFSDAKVFITNYPFDSNNRPYVKYYSNGDSKIHIVFTDGHPRNEATNSVYYAYYENGWFHKADGSKICSLENIPFEPKDASVIYKADEEKGRAWIYDVSSDENDLPVVLYARYPNESTHLYHYARLGNNGWLDIQMCDAGKWFPHTLQDQIEPEPHYSGGMTIHPRQANVVYVSQEIDSVFEITKYTYINKSEPWKTQPITSGSRRDNVRPHFPRNMKSGDVPVLLWMENEVYIHYTAYKSNIKYKVEE